MTANNPPSDRPSAPDDDPVRRAVVVATRRLRQKRTLRFGATGFLAGSIVGFVVAVAISTNLLRETTLPGGAAFLFLPTLAGLIAGAFYGAAGKYNSVSVARLLEKRLDLKDRLSTALSTKRDGSPLTEAQHRDAILHAPSESDVFSAVPLVPVPRRVYIAAAVALAVALAYFSPELPIFWSSTRRSEQVAVKKEGERLLAIAKAAAAEANKQNLPEAKKAAHKVETLGKEMTRGRMALREALMERAKLSEELRKAQDKILRERAERAEQQTKTDLTSTGRDLTKNLQNNGSTPGTDTTPNTSDARMKALQDALARGDKNKTAQALRDMADAAERGEPTPGAERDKTGQQLAALGDALNKNNLSEAGKSAQKAGDSMNNNAMPEAAQSLREAADKIEQSSSSDSQNRQTQQNNGNPQSQNSSSSSSGPAKEQNALQKMMNEVQKLAGGGEQQQGQSSQGSQSQNGSPQNQSGQGQQSSQSQGNQSQSQNGQQGQGSSNKTQSSGGQQNQGNRPGQSGTPSHQTGQNGSQGNKPGTGQGNPSEQGKPSGSKGSKSSGGNGAGNGSSGNIKSGDSPQRLGKGAREQNVNAKRSGEGPETVITENDKDRSGLPVSSLPYYKEFVKERGGPATEAAQTRDAVPNAYRNQVRGYFDSLPPAPKSGAKGQ